MTQIVVETVEVEGEVIVITEEVVVIPKVTGSAYITGYHQFVLDGEDPFPQGFWLKA